MIDGTVYLAVESSAGPRGTVLVKSDNPFGGFEQISTVMIGDAGTDSTAPFPFYDQSTGELWILLNHDNFENVQARHAPLNNLPSSSSGWTDEGIVISDASDPKTALVEDGTPYVAFRDISGANPRYSVMSGKTPATH